MPDEVLVTIKFRVKKDAVEEFKGELSDVVSDFVDESIAKQEGDIEVGELTE